MTDTRASELDTFSATKLKREMALVPSDSVAGRALVVVISIMTFLACLTAGGALLIAQASQGWRADVAREVTIQIKPRVGQDTEALIAKTVELAARVDGVAEARPMSKSESERMLEPWLGEGIDLSQLPVPRLIVVKLRDTTGAGLEPLRKALSAAAPEASLDDHRLWIARLDTMADAIVLFAASIFVLMIAAMATAIGFATRGAMAGNREIIEVLHFVGASDRFIAQQFQTHFFMLGYRGSAIGGAVALLFFGSAAFLSRWWTRSVGGEEIAALFGAFSLSTLGYLCLIAICAGVAGLTGLLSRAIAFNHLRTLL